MKVIKGNNQRMLIFKLPVFIGNWLDCNLWKLIKHSTDYYEHNKTFIIYLN